VRTRLHRLWPAVRDAVPASLARGLAWQYLGNLGSAVLSGGFILLIGRRLGVTDFGLYAVCVAAATVVFSLSEMRLQEVAIRFLADYRARQDDPGAASFLKAAYLLDAVLRIAAFLLVVTAGPWISTHIAKSAGSIEYITLAAAGLLLGRIANTPALGVLRVGRRFDLHAKALLAEGVARFASYGALDLAFGPSVQSALGAAVVGPLVSNMMIQVCAARIVRGWRLPVREARLAAIRPRSGELLRFAGSSYSISLFDVVVRELDTVIVAWYLSLADVGVYRMSKSIAQLIWRAGDPVFLVVMPEFAKLWSEGRRDDLKRLVKRIAVLLTLLAVVLLTGAYLAMPAFVPIVLGPQFLSVLRVFPAASWWIAVSLPLIWTHALAYAIGKPHLQLLANIFGNLIGLGLLISLTRLFGVTGAAMALSCSYAATFALAWMILRQQRWSQTQTAP
jgi:O-antigen/teichoic acid export membrane protein